MSSCVRKRRHSRPARVLLALVVVAVAVVLSATGGVLAARYLIINGIWAAASSPSEQAGDGGDSEQWYTCGMHPNVLQKGPGDCPICQMKLVPLKSDSVVEANGRCAFYSQEKGRRIQSIGAMD